MDNYKTKLQPECTYHIYSRANGKERLFPFDENYNYFLQKYKKYIVPIADTFCYCLMPNHFHFLIRFKSEENIKKLNQNKIDTVSNFISSRFQQFLNSYSKAYNKWIGRKGSLFMHPFKRKEIDTIDYFKKVVLYIHLNPVKANLCNVPEEWKYSSFNAMLSNNNSLLNKNEVIALFDDIENFTYVHQTSSIGNQEIKNFLEAL